MATARTTKAKAAKTVAASTRKKASRKKSQSPLAVCPTNGAGWCPYPFSVEQLKKRLKKKEQEARKLAAAST
ncbi:MAG: hypothetical protein K2W95_21470 [Candidatus Obscuribacterales bacterium]|nr:hypothetical protein [Candidatus Obscuribacterales bacterium]